MMTTTWRRFLYALGVGLAAPSVTATAQSLPELRLTRDLRIDAAANDLTRIFPPGGLAVAPNGTIAVTQNQDGTIRFFDAQGQPSGAFGRKGQGPGEFQMITSFMWIGDTLLASDGTTRRFTFISPDRTLLRSISWLPSVSVPARAGTEAPRVRATFPRARYADGSTLLTVSLATGSSTPDWPGGEKPGTPFIRVDSTGAFQRLMAWSTRARCSAAYDAGAGPGSGNLVIPFCHQTLEEASPDGKLLVLVSKESERPAFRVTAFRASGDTSFTRSIAFQAIAIPRSVADSARATRARGSQGQRDAAAKMQIPETYPPFARLIVGRDESIWIESVGPGAQRFWYVLDNRGAITGRATAPGNVQLMVVSRTAVFGIETDDDGFQSVVRFRVSP